MNTLSLSGIATLCFSLASMVQADPAWVGNSALNLRSGPGTEHAKVGTVSACASLELVGWQGSWAMVRTGGQTAWVAGSYLRTSPCSVVRAPAPRVSPEPAPTPPSVYTTPPRIPKGTAVPKYMTGIFRG